MIRSFAVSIELLLAEKAFLTRVAPEVALAGSVELLCLVGAFRLFLLSSKLFELGANLREIAVSDYFHSSTVHLIFLVIQRLLFPALLRLVDKALGIRHHKRGRHLQALDWGPVLGLLSFDRADL